MSRPWLALVESNTTGTGPLFIQAARDLNLRPVLLTADATRYDYIDRFADLEVRRVDTTNEERLLETLNQLRASSSLAGVTSSSEYFIATAAALANRLGLPGPDPLAVRNCRDKGLQRERLRAAGAGVPLFIVAGNAPEAVAAARIIGLPVVLKPVNGTGSSGVRLCYNFTEAEEHAGNLLSLLKNERGIPVPPRVLVEQFINGREFSVETLGAEVIGITEKHLGVPPHFVETGHDFPCLLAPVVAESLKRATIAALKALGLGWGPAHTELRLTAEGPKIIEVNPRLAGGMIPELVRQAENLDLIGETLRAVAGLPRSVRQTGHLFASLRFVIPENQGCLVALEGLNEARSLPGVVSVETYYQPGRLVGQWGDFRDRIGHVIARGQDSETAKAMAARALKVIKPLVGNQEGTGTNGRYRTHP